VDGTPYVSGVRIFGIAAHYSDELYGEAAFKGVNLLNLPLAHFCRAVVWWCLKRVEDREQFMFMLEQPVPGRPVSERVVEAELDEFAAFMTGI
jgi:hypothetical protein